jgi:hypothetical protein
MEVTDGANATLFKFRFVAEISPAIHDRSDIALPQVSPRRVGTENRANLPRW